MNIHVRGSVKIEYGFVKDRGALSYDLPRKAPIRHLDSKAKISTSTFERFTMNVASYNRNIINFS